MNIAQLRVQIGDHEVTIKDCTDDDVDIRALLAAATESKAEITIRVPQDDETASVLGRLTYGSPKSRIIVGNELIDELSKLVADLELSVRTLNVLDNAGIVYVWQLTQMTEAELLKIKNCGRMSLNEIKEILDDMHLSLGMDLSGVRAHLPNPPERG